MAEGKVARIGLIHAVQVAVAPVSTAFQQYWPQAEILNLLEDRLSPDHAKNGALTDEMNVRIAGLADYCVSAGCDAIMYTCSAFGPAIEAVDRKLPQPVFKPNQAMFDEAFSFGNRIGMLATFGPSVSTMEEEFSEASAGCGSSATLKTVLVDHALDALKSGDAETHNRLVAARAAELSDCDAIMLAHFSTSHAQQAVQAQVGIPILTSPSSAVVALRKAVEGEK